MIPIDSIHVANPGIWEMELGSIKSKSDNKHSSLQEAFFGRPLRDSKPENFRLFERKLFFGLAMVNQSKKEFKALQKPGAKSEDHEKIMSSISNIMTWHDMEFVFMDSEVEKCLKKQSSMGGDFDFKYHGTERDSVLRKFRVQCTTLPGSSKDSRQILISILLFKSMWRANEYEAAVTNAPVYTAPPTQRWKPESERQSYEERPRVVRMCWKRWCWQRPFSGCIYCQNRYVYRESRQRKQEITTPTTEAPRIVTKKRKMTLLDRSKIFEDSERELRAAIMQDYGGYLEAFNADTSEEQDE